MASEPSLEANLEKAREGILVLSNYAIENGVDPTELCHLSAVFEDGAYHTPPYPSDLNDEVQGLMSVIPDTRAFMLARTGQVFFDEQRPPLHVVLHESLHRIGWLKDRQRGLSTSHTHLLLQVAEDNFMKITPEGTVDPESEYITAIYKIGSWEKRASEVTKNLRNDLNRFTEGLTEWTTKKALALMGISDSTESPYLDELLIIKKIAWLLVEREGLTPQEVEVALVNAALTGDVGKFVQYI